MIRVCSGFSPAGQIQYGDRFVATFDRFWPPQVQLQVYVEQATPLPRASGRNLWQIPGALEFHVKHREDRRKCGLVPTPGWKPRDHQHGYCYRYDAMKFWKQILIPGAAAADMPDGALLIWLDGDVETIAPIQISDIEGLVGSAEVAYLNRDPKHSEIGFWAVRLNARTRAFLADMALIFTADEVFALPEWHSAYVWDVARRRSDLVEHSICPRGSRGHVWPTTPLARWLRHDKGKRKPR